MQIVYNVALGIAIVLAVVYSILIYATGKGDAMSGGGGGVRTTFKGKASFDDIVSKWALILGCSFIGLMLVIDVIGNNLPKK